MRGSSTEVCFLLACVCAGSKNKLLETKAGYVKPDLMRDGLHYKVLQQQSELCFSNNPMHPHFPETFSFVCLRVLWCYSVDRYQHSLQTHTWSSSSKPRVAKADRFVINKRWPAQINITYGKQLQDNIEIRTKPDRERLGRTVRRGNSFVQRQQRTLCQGPNYTLTPTISSREKAPGGTEKDKEGEAKGDNNTQWCFHQDRTDLISCEYPGESDMKQHRAGSSKLKSGISSVTVFYSVLRMVNTVYPDPPHSNKRLQHVKKQLQHSHRWYIVNEITVIKIMI